ncbi:glycosyltransferase family 4 protein [Geodermatophilus ruber]|uniref:Glycosyltransferase involved in cell wall bisynthesis n=1 Tax=Geodermatophilus ruber TaxID=504800 RepID=A0A1I4DI64_9ACTN|nr:glycosyltransferase family 4 protein [Geodermatophilus ruber]SFK92167.1 Glycosyltransferase involved in cell wall bisynthesis [Geodermatophilus ruber]
MSSTDGRPIAVVLVGQAAPARGGIASFMANLLTDPDLGRSVDYRLLNVTRRAERAAGRFSVENVRHALEDAVRCYRAARQADVVHVQTALLPVLPLVRALLLCGAARLAGAGVLCHVHSGRLNSGRPEAFRPTRPYRLLLRALRVTAHRVLAVAAPGERILRELVPGLSVATVHNAVDVGAYSPADPAVEPPRAVYVGTLSRRKGMHDLVAALELLRDRGVALDLDVVGGGHEVGEEEADELRNRIHRSGLPVRLLGSLPPEEVTRALRGAQLFVLPSHWEGQPIAILEAMASGLPVVVTAVGANGDVVRDGVDGRVVPSHDPAALADALESLVRDPALRARMGADARSRAEKGYDRPVLAGRMLQEYRQLGSAGRRPRQTA